MYRTKYERAIEEALREQAIEISNTAPMQASFGQPQEGRVRSFLRRIGNRWQRVKEHVRRNKGKYMLAGAVGAAGAAMLHRAAKIESPRYAEFVKQHTNGFMDTAKARAEKAYNRIKPHVDPYVDDARWLGKKSQPILRKAAKYPRLSMLVGALAAERAHKIAYRNVGAYRGIADAVGAKVRSFIDDSPILTAATADMQEKIGQRIGKSVRTALGTHIDSAAEAVTGGAADVVSGRTNPLKGLGRTRRVVRAKKSAKSTKRRR